MHSFDEQITFLSVGDLQASVRFYNEILGLEVVLDQDDCRIFRVTQTSYIGICSRADRVPRNDVIITLVTSKVDETHEVLVAAGVPCDKPPQKYGKYNLYHAFYQDPDGHIVEIQQFLDPNWAGGGTSERT